jgi:hypothetical protein
MWLEQESRLRGGEEGPMMVVGRRMWVRSGGVLAG